jgi:hypothetical protein
MDDIVLICAWFALCNNETTTGLLHPVLGAVPCCTRCAAKIGETAKLIEIEIIPAT